jgi:hypothetical protein
MRQPAHGYNVRAKRLTHSTPCAQKGTKKTYEIFVIAFELSIVFGSPW